MMNPYVNRRLVRAARRTVPPVTLGALAYEYGPSAYGYAKDIGRSVGRRAYKAASDYYSGKNQGVLTVRSKNLGKNRYGGAASRAKSSLLLTKKQNSQQKQISLLTKLAKASLGTLRYRRFEAFRIDAGINSQSVTSLAGSNLTLMEGALAYLKYYDPSNPATLITSDAATGTYQKQILFKKQSSSLKLRNNYATDCEVTVYLCKPREDTSIVPSTAWNNGCTDGSNTSNTALGQYPSDYEQFRELWISKRMVKKQLSPGQEIVCKHTEKDVSYDPSVSDSHAMTFQKRNRAFMFMIVLRGILSHDSVLNEQGTSQASLDVEQTHSYVLNYDAGIDLEYTYLDSITDTPTNGFVSSNSPASAQQAYSL